MTITDHTHRHGPVPGAGDVLGDAVRWRWVADDAERQLLVTAVAWAHAHPADGDEEAVTGPCLVDGTEVPDWDELPAVAWDAGVEFAAALGMSQAAGERLLVEALELRHRLPGVWGEVLAGRVQAWRARRIAQHTLGHPGDVAAWVDERVAPVAARVGVGKLDKLLDEAMLRLHPAEREAADKAALDARQVRMLANVSASMVAHIVIDADFKDCDDFMSTVNALAARLGEAGCEESLDVRRSLAVGILADPEAALTLLNSSPDTDTDTDESAAAPQSTKPARPGARRKQIRLVVHLSADALTRHSHSHSDCGCGCGCPDAVALGRLGREDVAVLASMVANWCGRSDTDLVVTPVIDTGEHIHVDRYEIPDRLVRQVEQAHPTCVFPWCTRAARACDKDHIVPHGEGGATCSCNLAPLCRRHHRYKTLTGWDYHQPSAGVFVWTSPRGRCYLRDHSGTVDLTAPTGPTDGCAERAAAHERAAGRVVEHQWTPDDLREHREHLQTNLAAVASAYGPPGWPIDPPDDLCHRGEYEHVPEPWEPEWDQYASPGTPPWDPPPAAVDDDTPPF
ncbi:hypothetical protein [Nocardioides sp. AE5]|uniref:HNH endonuclease signature motif containing protein n=1 Tax=Nocardioides sp. AE5 TaxID=2962573 RepID=UPI0028815589|nr:hypothetical protein [Nocardioides sp. AE5]MDT0201094.1 hypothetical protein [Nocardioides sp. AE5]